MSGVNVSNVKTRNESDSSISNQIYRFARPTDIPLPFLSPAFCRLFLLSTLLLAEYYRNQSTMMAELSGWTLKQSSELEWIQDYKQLIIIIIIITIIIMSKTQ